MTYSRCEVSDLGRVQSGREEAHLRKGKNGDEEGEDEGEDEEGDI